MRDTQKMKDKFELSLEGHHLITLTVVGLVAVGAAFAMGLAVGKKQAREDGAGAPQPDVFAALDARADRKAPAQGSADASLTFQESLTRKAPVLVIDKPTVKIEKVADVVPKAPAAPAVEKVAAAAVEKPAPVALAAPPAPVAEPVAAPEPGPAAPPAEAMVATRTAGDAGRLSEAIARASRPAQTAADGQWTLQLSAYQDKAEAERYLAGLRDRGYAAYVVEAQVVNKGTWYRVRMGRFASREAAARYLADFQRETQISAFVTNVQ